MAHSAGRTLLVHSSQHLPGDYPQGDVVTHTASSQLSLAQAVFTRRSEFTRPHTVRIRVGTWNVASHKRTDKDLGDWFVSGKGISESLSSTHASEGLQSRNEDASEHSGGPDREGVGEQEERWRRSHNSSTIPKHDQGSLPGHEDIGIYALALQEIVDINSATEALRPFTDSAPANKFKDALVEAMPKGYQLVAERQLIGLLLLVYASPTIAPHIRSVSTTSVGTGLMGYMGNKGAVTARLILGETTRLVFINSHLSAGTGKQELERRNWDASQILSRTRFDPITDDCGITHAAEKIGDEDFAFWLGDLNYRLNGLPDEDVRRILMHHTKNEYDIGQRSERTIERELVHGLDATRGRDRASTTSSYASNSTISTHSSERFDTRSAQSLGTSLNHNETANSTSGSDSLQMTIDSLLAHDELHEQQRTRKMFHDGWREGPITFLPTYKYDRGTVGVFDSGEKKRGPSWCDRILYRTRKDRIKYEEKIKTEEEARDRDNDIKAKGIDKAVEDENTLFDYDPDADGDDDYIENNSVTSGGHSSLVVTKEGFEDTIRLEYYTSHMRVLSSDHKPLDAGFVLKYEAVIPELKAKIQQEVARELDKVENEGRPILTMVVDNNPHEGSAGSDGVDFGKLKFDEPSTRSVTIANTGRVPAMFGITNRPDDVSNSTTRWITVMVGHASEKSKPAKEDEEWYSGVPKVFILMPGESCTVELTARISDKDLVRSLKEDENLEDVLVLRIKDGRDHFLPVRGLWQNSSHGLKLDRLLRVPEGGFRKLQNQHPIGSWSRGGRDLTQSGEDAVIIGSVPVQISALTGYVEALVERVLAEWSILGSVDEDEPPPWARFAGWPFVNESWTLDAKAREVLRRRINLAIDLHHGLDTSFKPDTLPLHRLEVVAEALLHFLANIHDGVIPANLWSLLQPDIVSSSPPPNQEPSIKTTILETLSLFPDHTATFLHLTSFLSRTSRELVSALQDQFTPAQLEKQFLNKEYLDKVKLTRKMLSKDKGAAVKKVVAKTFAVVFGEVIVRTEGEGEGGKEEKGRLVDLFLED